MNILSYMKQLLITIAAVVLVGCSESQTTELPPEPPNISIHQAAEDGNIKAIKQHIAAGTDVNAKNDRSTWTPLYYAVLKGRKEIAELLITEGADVNAKNQDGETPLDYAIHPENFPDVAEKPPTSSANTAARRVKN